MRVAFIPVNAITTTAFIRGQSIIEEIIMVCTFLYVLWSEMVTSQSSNNFFSWLVQVHAHSRASTNPSFVHALVTIL